MQKNLTKIEIEMNRVIVYTVFGLNTTPIIVDIQLNIKWVSLRL